MSRAVTIKLLQTTKSSLDSEKTGSGLLVAEPYYITDENRVAIGIAVNNYVELALKSELDLVNDTTPQLGGSLDLNSKPIIEIFTAGESLSDGDLCYLKSDGKFWKTDCDAAATTKGLLGLANEAITADNTGEFILFGKKTLSSLTQGSTYYVSGTAGAITATAPSGGQFARFVGYALTTTVLFFNPSQTYITTS